MQANDQMELRRRVLRELGGPPEAIEALLRYNENHFDPRRLPPRPVFPMAEELHVTDWRTYAAECGLDVFGYLRGRLVQLCMPIQTGVSKTEAYADVVRRGKPFDAAAFGGRLTLERPDLLRLVIHEHPAGALPVLLAPHRPDFVALDRALGFRSEPVEIPSSVNAHLVSGLANWDRLRRYQAAWTARQPAADGAAWVAEMQRVAAAEPARFYDRVMLLGVAPYSAAGVWRLGLNLDEVGWLEASTALRLEHEFTHLAIKRLYDRMVPILLDELICDWVGITAALGRFKGPWLLTFLGLESWPQVWPEGRVHFYREGLDEEAFRLLCAVAVRAAHGLEALSQRYPPTERTRFFLALTRMTLELLACDQREGLFADAYREAGRLLGKDGEGGGEGIGG
jgi:hypothetical protein